MPISDKYYNVDIGGTPVSNNKKEPRSEISYLTKII